MVCAAKKKSELYEYHTQLVLLTSHNLSFTGAPSNVTFTNVTVDYIDPEVFIQFNMTDVSDAPAKGVYIRVGDLEAALILFSEPNSNMSKMYSRKLTALLNETAPMLYNIELISFNDLGNGTIMSERMFIAGMNKRLLFPFLYFLTLSLK